MLQIFLTSSIILNSILLVYMFGLIPFLLFMSILVNIISITYIYFLLRDRMNGQDDLSSLMLRSENFIDHLESIYELEMFYGDETLESLIKHSKEFINDFYEYGDKHYMEIEEETTEQEHIQEKNDNDTTDKQNQEQENKAQE